MIFFPAQIAHPCPDTVRLETLVLHACDVSTGHLHHTTRILAYATSAGKSRPFFVGCHCAATAGAITESALSCEVRWCEQNGQPCPPRARLLITYCHSWSGARGHLHHTFRLEPDVTSRGVSAPFLVGCHCRATVGAT
jgi:hypothetical protein